MEDEANALKIMRRNENNWRQIILSHRSGICLNLIKKWLFLDHTKSIDRINIFSNLNFSKNLFENNKLYQITIQSKRLNNVNVIFASKFIDVEKQKKKNRCETQINNMFGCFFLVWRTFAELCTWREKTTIPATRSPPPSSQCVIIPH